MPNCEITNTPENKLEPDDVNAPDRTDQLQRERDIVRRYFDYERGAMSDIGENFIVVDEVNAILMDAEDDKLGRIRDLLHSEKERCVKFVTLCKDNSSIANFHFNEAMRLYG